MDIKDLLNKIATPGDAAAAGIGFVLGLPVDFFLLHMAVPPGVVSAYTAIGAFSLKKGADAYIASLRQSRAAWRERLEREREAKELSESKEKEAKELHEKLSSKRWRLESFFEKENPETAKLIEELYDMRTSEIISDEELDRSLKQVIEKYRHHRFLKATQTFSRLELPPASFENEAE
jgi:hypothetical protein